MVDELARSSSRSGRRRSSPTRTRSPTSSASDGVHWLLDASAGLQLDVFFMAPSCVPASPFESPLRRSARPTSSRSCVAARVLGLAEMMNFPGVDCRAPRASSRSSRSTAPPTSTAMRPACSGKELQAYAAAGIRSDHEALTVEEGRERLRAGMWLLIREASMARNLRALLPLVEEFGPGRIAFCTDDRDPEDIADYGARERDGAGAVGRDRTRGRDRHGSFHPALARPRPSRCDAPGLAGDLLVLPDLVGFVPELVLKRGLPIETARAPVPDFVRQTVRIEPVDAAELRDPVRRRPLRAIGLIEDQVVTVVARARARRVDGHGDSGRSWRRSRSSSATSRRVGSEGFLAGSGLVPGALASSVAHDAHNLVVVGNERMRTWRSRCTRLAQLGGGIVAVDGDRVVAECPLPVAGLLSEGRSPTSSPRAGPATRPPAQLGWSGRDAVPDACVPRALGDSLTSSSPTWARRRRPPRDRPASRGEALTCSPAAKRPAVT